MLFHYLLLVGHGWLVLVPRLGLERTLPLGAYSFAGTSMSSKTRLPVTGSMLVLTVIQAAFCTRPGAKADRRPPHPMSRSVHGYLPPHPAMSSVGHQRPNLKTPPALLANQTPRCEVSQLSVRIAQRLDEAAGDIAHRNPALRVSSSVRSRTGDPRSSARGAFRGRRRGSAGSKQESPRCLPRRYPPEGRAGGEFGVAVRGRGE